MALLFLKGKKESVELVPCAIQKSPSDSLVKKKQNWRIMFYTKVIYSCTWTLCFELYCFILMPLDSVTNTVAGIIRA